MESKVFILLFEDTRRKKESKRYYENSYLILKMLESLNMLLFSLIIEMHGINGHLLQILFSKLDFRFLLDLCNSLV